MLTPAIVHYGQVDTILDQRQRVLKAAYAAHPERFVNKPPKPLPGPTEVWINPPHPTPENENQPLIETQGPQEQPNTESEPRISLLTSAKQPGRLLIPANLDPSLNKALTQITNDGPLKPQQNRTANALPHYLTSAKTQTRYTNFLMQVSQTR